MQKALNLDRRNSNPFPAVPMPIPFRGSGVHAAEVFSPEPLGMHLSRNASWLQARTRTTREIHSTLFPSYSRRGMEPDEVRAALNHALWQAGYTPSSLLNDNPTWNWFDGEPTGE